KRSSQRMKSPRKKETSHEPDLQQSPAKAPTSRACRREKTAQPGTPSTEKRSDCGFGAFIDIVQRCKKGGLRARADGLRRCESPLCSVEFEPSGLPVKPKRFCCDRCKQDASILRRAADLLKNLSDEKALAILRGQKELR